MSDMLTWATVVLDALILAWLVGTWFYEGHHRRCTVITECPKCGGTGSVHCASADTRIRPTGGSSGAPPKDTWRHAGGEL